MTKELNQAGWFREKVRDKLMNELYTLPLQELEQKQVHLVDQIARRSGGYIHEHPYYVFFNGHVLGTSPEVEDRMWTAIEVEPNERELNLIAELLHYRQGLLDEYNEMDHYLRQLLTNVVSLADLYGLLPEAVHQFLGPFEPEDKALTPVAREFQAQCKERQTGKDAKMRERCFTNLLIKDI